MNKHASISIVPIFTRSPKEFLAGCWLHFVGVQRTGGMEITDHPDYEPVGPTPIIYDSPVLDCSTAALKVGGVKGGVKC